jgi:hypothetical protein
MMTNENGKSTRKMSHRRSYFGPILLIAVGLIFLAKNIGLIPGEGWGTIWRLWPILLIVAGVDDLFRRQGVAWPILMIGSGIFLLVNYFGPQTQISWTQIIQLWPILLIAVGIDILFKDQSSGMTVVGILLAVLLLGGAVWLTGQQVTISADYQQISEALTSEIDSSELSISLDVGELVIGDDGESDRLITGNITPGDALQGLDIKGGKGQYHLESRGPDFFPHTARWELELNPAILSDIQIQSGVGELVLDIGELDLDALLVNQGVGRIVVQLPDSSARRILIKQGVGEIRVLLPQGSRIAVDAQNGLSKVNFPGGFELEDGYYVTSGTNNSNADLLITVEQGVGLVDFRYR